MPEVERTLCLLWNYRERKEPGNIPSLPEKDMEKVVEPPKLERP